MLDIVMVLLSAVPM